MPESTSTSPARALLRKYGIPAGIAIIVAGGAGTALASQAQPAAHAAPSPSVSAPVIGLDSPTGSPTASATAAPTGMATPSASAGSSWSVSTTTNGAGQGGPSASATAIPAKPKYYDGAHAQGPTLSPWKQTARAFATAWADPSGGKDAWLSRMAPYTTPDLLKEFGYTDITKVQADTLKGLVLEQDGGANLRFSASFNNQGYAMDALMVVQPDGTWRVSQVGAPAK